MGYYDDIQELMKRVDKLEAAEKARAPIRPRYEEGVEPHFLVKMAMDLHMARWGTSSPLDPSTARTYLAAIKDRLETWRESGSPAWAEFDYAVKRMLAAAVAEYNDAPSWMTEGR